MTTFDLSNSYQLEVVNVVGTGTIVGNVNLEHLFSASDSSIVQYDPVHHQGCYLRFEGSEGPLLTMYNSGKYIIRAESVEKVYQQKRELIDYLDDIGVPNQVEEVDFSINNIVSTTELDLDLELDLNTLEEDLKYSDESETTGRLLVRYPDDECTITLFRNGVVVILGAKSIGAAEATLDKFIQELSDLFAKERNSK